MGNREAFEKEFKLKWEVGHYILKMVKFIDESNDYAPINAVKTMSDEYYWVLALNTGWWAWQARVHEGYVVVPVKCTNNMAHAAKEVDGRLSAFKYGDVWKAMIEAVEK